MRPLSGRHLRPIPGLYGVHRHALCPRFILAARLLGAGLLRQRPRKLSLLHCLSAGDVFERHRRSRLRRNCLPRRPVRPYWSDVYYELLCVPSWDILGL